MNRRTKGIVGAALFLAWSLCLCCRMAQGAEDANGLAVNSGVTVWALGGPGMQEGRVGWLAPLGVENIELALCGVHIDAPDGEIERWPLRGYVMAHALDAQMLATLLGADVKLPPGALYGGLFAEYAWDREHEWSGGYSVGGLVTVQGWDLVAEYQATICNATDNGYEFVGGLRRRF
jgi:hypothetical protein